MTRALLRAGLIALLAGGALAAPRPVTVTFPDRTSPPTATLTAEQRSRITRLVRETLGVLEPLTGLRAGPVKVFVFADRLSYQTTVKVAAHFGGFYSNGAILLQPLPILERSGAFERIVRHEAVHHLFAKPGRRWPNDLHEALAHYYSGGVPRESARAAELADRERTPEEEMQYEDHLAWRLSRLILAEGGERPFFRRLLGGRLDLTGWRSSGGSGRMRP